MIFLTDSKLVKEFLIVKYDNYKKNTFSSNIDLFLNNGLLFSEGAQWKN